MLVQTLSAMRDNVYHSDELLNEIYSVPFATDNFCNGHVSNVNFKMKTKFENKENLHNAVQFIYGKKINEFRKSSKMPVFYDLVDSSLAVKKLTITNVVVPNVMIPTEENLHQETSNKMQIENQDDNLGGTSIMSDKFTTLDNTSAEKIQW